MRGYIKRVPLSTYRAQRRGGRGRTGMAMREEDFVSQVFVASTHAPVLFFTSSGRVYKLKVYRLPIGTPQSRGKAMVNLLPNLAPGETITTVMPLAEDESRLGGAYVVFATAKGQRAAQCALRFRQRPRHRQDRHEVRGRGCRRPAHRRRDLHRRTTTCCWRRATGAASASRSRMCASSPAAPRSACAASAYGRGRCGDLAVDPAPRRRADRAALCLSAVSPASGAAPAPARSSPTSPRPRTAMATATVSERQRQRRNVTGTITEEQYADLAAREEFVLTITEKGFGKRTLGLRVSDHRARRAGARQHRARARPGRHRRRLPGRGGRPDHAGADQRHGDPVPVDGISIRRRAQRRRRPIKVDEGERVVSAARFPEAGESVVDGTSEGTEA